MPDDDPDRRKGEQARQLLEASAIGWMFPIAIGIGWASGWGLDKLFGTKPWLMWIFTGFGVAAAFINLFRAALPKDS